MALLSGVRRIFSRGARPAAGPGSNAAAPDAGEATGSPAPSPLVSAMAHGTPATPAKPAATPVTGAILPAPPAATPRSRPGSRARNREDLQRLVEHIGDRLDRQESRSDRMIELLGGVHERLEPMADLARRQAHLVESAQEHAEQLARRDERMNAAIVQLAETTRHQASMIETVRGQLEANHAETRELRQAIGGLEQSLLAMVQMQERSQATFDQLREESLRREDRFSETVRSASRWMVVAAICCCVAAVAAIITAMVAVLA
jgi:hypothetical protein